MQKKFFLLITALLFLVGCQNQPDNTTTIDSLKDYYGKWHSDWGDGFEIKTDSTFICYNDLTGDVAYKGTIADTDVSGDYTFISIKLSDPSRSPWGLAVGSYTRVALKKSSTATECDMATACISNGTVYDQTADTLATVKTKFTLETGAFGRFGTYKKQ